MRKQGQPAADVEEGAEQDRLDERTHGRNRHCQGKQPWRALPFLSQKLPHDLPHRRFLRRQGPHGWRRRNWGCSGRRGICFAHAVQSHGHRAAHLHHRHAAMRGGTFDTFFFRDRLFDVRQRFCEP